MNDIPCTYRISVKAIIKDAEGRILLFREKDGYWELPGGGLEHDENPKEALSREITEETGMKVSWISELPVAFWTIHKDVSSPILKWFAFVVYEAKVSGEFVPNPNSDESHGAQYFNPKEAIKLKLHNNVKPYFNQLINNV